MKVNVLTGGPLACVPQSIFEQKDERWCGVDYGAVELIDRGISPMLSIGDFDTATDEERLQVEEHSYQFVYRPLKDDITDTELALRYLFAHYSVDQLNLYGATGARMDQLLANLFFILKPEYQEQVERITVIDRWNEMRFFKPGHHQLKRDSQMKYLAFIPLTAVEGLMLPDEKYQLQRTDFDFPVALSSNEFVGEKATFSFERGILMTVQSCD
ncbi:thiamine diphosphokinase [Ligilactobacillus aviarius]|uniref:thiamine diphosphokinase n=1 Tax=Ligilactobacillus aviarius TaxID=1606 RepID=UPI0024B9ED9B|nr:thiamine diphosphokinase [Ligilactobacillus aviarius]MDM8278301.1 thiamine diphosphokinase [Ligilactobacillus aviarius]